MLQRLTLVLQILVLTTLAGCSDSDAEHALAENDSTYDAEWNERNAEVYRYLFSRQQEPPSGQINFITTTPMAEWTDSGGWYVIPSEELAPYPAASKFRPADKALWQEGGVLEKETNAPACMRWVSIKRWVSSTEVEVEEGWWCHNLGGGAGIVFYEKVDGQWRYQKPGPTWTL